MQDRDDELRILNAKLGTLDDLRKEPMPANATSRTIGILPQKGEIVKLRGLDFQVRFVNNRTGELRLALSRDAEHRLEQTDGSEINSVKEDSADKKNYPFR